MIDRLKHSCSQFVVHVEPATNFVLAHVLFTMHRFETVGFRNTFEKFHAVGTFSLHGRH